MLSWLKTSLLPLQFPHHFTVIFIKEVLFATFGEIFDHGQIACIPDHGEVGLPLGVIFDEGSSKISLVLEGDECFLLGFVEGVIRLEQLM